MTTATHGPDVGQLTFDDGAPHHDDRRQRICRAIYDAAWLDGIADPNAVRGALLKGDRFDVDPRAYSGAWSWLKRRGIITPAGWTTNDDTRSGNGGKPIRTYTVTDWPALADLAGVER